LAANTQQATLAPVKGTANHKQGKSPVLLGTSHPLQKDEVNWEKATLLLGNSHPSSNHKEGAGLLAFKHDD